MKIAFLVLAVAFAGDATGADTAVNRVLGSIDIAADRVVGNVSTVNGGIDIGSKAVVAAVETVNGHVRLGAGASAKSLETVNGGITLETGARVSGKVETVNGSLRLAPGAEVGAALRNVNGGVTIDGAHVAGQLRTSTGSIETTNGARLDGGILVDENHGNWGLFTWGTPRIVIGPGSVIGGPLKFQRKVILFISDRAVIAGPIEGAVPTPFSGDRPPR
jgi:hypothetical protein